jgi:hypothetical protein
MQGWIQICFLSLLGLAAPAAALTPEEAQTLPVPELAAKVLGEAGATVIDVDRPRWPVCEGFCPTEDEGPRTQAPPLSLGLTFYQRPIAATGGQNEWTGLCAVGIVGVQYDSEGKVQSFGSGIRYGVRGSMQRRASNPADFMKLQSADNAACAANADVRSYFIADDDVAAFRAALAFRMIADASRSPAPLPFALKCRSEIIRECNGQARSKSFLERLDVSAIASVFGVDCKDADSPLQRVAPDGCYEIGLRAPMGQSESLILEVADAYAEMRIVRLEYRQGRVVY